MGVRDSVLLILNQSSSLDYNSLLNKLQENYSSINSARAALSRTLKELGAFGLITRKGNSVYITDKGKAQIRKEMKSKLLEKLNSLIKHKNNFLEIDSIVQYLHTLIERSKNDKDLKKIVINAADFTISELAKINDRIEKQRKHLERIQGVFQEQLISLKELGFNDFKTFNLDEQIKARLIELQAKSSVKEFTVSSNNYHILNELAKRFDKKIEKQALVLPNEKFPDIINSYVEVVLPVKDAKLTIFSSKFVFKLFDNNVTVTGPAQELEFLSIGL